MNYWIWRVSKEENEFKAVYKRYMDTLELRQGWGAPGLDLRDGLDNFVKNWKWADEDAQDHYSRLHPMLDIRRGDKLIIPNMIPDINYYVPNAFSIAHCIEEYSFRNCLNKTTNPDFGHCIRVAITSSVYRIDPYGEIGSYIWHCRNRVTKIDPSREDVINLVDLLTGCKGEHKIFKDEVKK